jgi:hypothetical protein
MSEYTRTIITDFPEEITGTRTTPAADHLFKVRDKAEARPLLEEQAREFPLKTQFLICQNLFVLQIQ